MMLAKGRHIEIDGTRVGVFNDESQTHRVWTTPAVSGVECVLYRHEDKQWELLAKFRAPTDSIHDVQRGIDHALSQLRATA